MSDRIVNNVARTVRHLRMRRNWTIDQLADRSGVSKGAVVAVENGTTNPSLSTLVRLADVLDISVSRLLGDEIDTSVRIVDHAAVRPLWRGELGSQASLILTVPGVAPVELWKWELIAGERYVSHPHPGSVMETVTVLCGSLDLTIGDCHLTIATGQTATFAANRDHAYAASDANCSFMMTVHLHASPETGTT